jgi:hypothetical protein
LKNKSSFTPVRTIAIIVLLAAAAASLVMVIRAGRHNSSIILPILFILWVLSPFAVLLIANWISKPWTTLTRLTLYWLMLVISVGSVISYSGLINPPGMKAAFLFLITPLLSLLLTMTGILIAASISRNNNERRPLS